MSRPYLLLILCVPPSGVPTSWPAKPRSGTSTPIRSPYCAGRAPSLLVLPFAVRPLRRDWPVLRAKWWLLLFYGALGFGTFNALCYIAAYYTTGFNIGLDQVTINIFVMLLSFIFFRTRVKALQLVGVAITIAGVALTVSHGDITRVLALDVNFGDLLVLLASLGYAIYSICLRWRPQTDWRSFLVATFIGAILASLVFVVTAGGGLGAGVRHPNDHAAGLGHRALHDGLPLDPQPDVLRARRRTDRCQPRQPVHQSYPAVRRGRLGADPRGKARNLPSHRRRARHRRHRDCRVERAAGLAASGEERHQRRDLLAVGLVLGAELFHQQMLFEPVLDHE